MQVRTKHRSSLAVMTALLIAAGCGSGDSTSNLDGSGGLPPTSLDGKPSNDVVTAPDGGGPGLDAGTSADVAMETGGANRDAFIPSVDGGGATAETAGPGLDGGRRDGSGSGLDTTTPKADAPGDAAPDGFSPGPATPIVVNSSNTGVYNLADGTWKVFYFDAAAGQLYCISDLSGIVHGYVSTSPSVSPTLYQYTTSADGTLAFTAPTAQRYYIAVGVSGGGASGSFQVADGGRLLSIGANTVALTAPDGDNIAFFRFPITAGQGYTFSATGLATTSVGLGLSPKAERASNGQFSTPLVGVSGPLPFNEDIPSTSVALSYSGYYFFFLRVYQAMTITVTLTQK